LGLGLWAEYLEPLAAALIDVGDPMWLGAPVESSSGYVWAKFGVGRPPHATRRAMIEG